MTPIPAAGTVPWRLDAGELAVALVHRPRYDDWSWPKGKLDPGEEWVAAAARETEEETGLHVRIGIPLPPADYPVLDKVGGLTNKLVRYWAAQVIGGHGRLINEIDEIAWLTSEQAHARLDYSRDREQLRALVAAHLDGGLVTWPLLLVRHAHAAARGAWKGADALRPLDDRGRARATAIVPLIGAYAPRRVLTSPSVRCADTIGPYAATLGQRVRPRPALSEEAFAQNPLDAIALLEKVIQRAKPTVICTHGPLVPDLLGHLMTLGGAPLQGRARSLLEEAAEVKMIKGEVLVVHVAGAGGHARPVGVERHRGPEAPDDP